MIATDHAPHHADEKMVEFDRAPFGIVGLETARADRVRSARARRPDHVARMIELLSVNPARVLNLPGGIAGGRGAGRHHHPRAGRDGRRSSAAALRSKSKNTPFDGWELRGGVAATIVGGAAVSSTAAE